MKKIIILVMICCGAVLGFWMARQNQRLFELPFPKEQLQHGKTVPAQTHKSVKIGMDLWQVEEILGPPLARRALEPQDDIKKEIWVYKDRRLYFENGYLKREEGVVDRGVDPHQAGHVR